MAQARAYARKIANLTGRPVVLVRRRRNPWITSRGRKVEIDEKGRIVRGLARGLEGVPIRRLPAYWKKRRRLESPATCRLPRGVPLFYKSKGEAYAALLDANPQLVTLLEGVGGAGLVGRSLREEQAAYKAGVKGATLWRGQEGGIDAIAAYLDVPPARLGSLANAILQLMPGPVAGRRPRWTDLDRIFPILTDAVGDAFGDFGINPPMPYILARAALDEGDRCRDAVAGEVAQLGQRFRPRRRVAAASVPF